MQKIKLTSIILFMVIIFFVQPKSYSQIFKTFPQGLGIEMGLGQNNLYWRARSLMMSLGLGPCDRTEIFLTTNVRINYNMQFENILSAIIFIGYNRFGGSSKNYDKYLFNALEGGSFVLYNISDLKFGIGFKTNHFISIQYNNEDRSELFSNWSENIGIRAMYLFSPFSISLESWFGLTDLRESI
ncbi:MAG: hypothetical protein P8Z35_16905 [Ignavibacteriaceae bacterium]